MASSNRPTLAITGGLDKQATKKVVQAQLDKLGSELKLTIGVDKNAGKDAKGVTEEKKKQLNVEKLISEAKERTARAEQKQFDLARSKTSKLLKQEIQDRVTIEKQTLKQANAEKIVTSELDKQREKLRLFQEEFNRKVIKAESGKFKNTLDTDALSSLQSKVGGMSIGDGSDFKSVQSEMNKVNSQFKDITLNAQQARTGMTRFKEEIVDSGKKFTQYFILGGLIVGAINSLKMGVQSVFELDKALTELKKVTTATNEEINQFTKDSYDMADALASTNIQVIEAVTIFSKMGYALDQSKQLGALAVKLQTVGDGMGSVEDTANSLVAVLKGFGVDENSAISEVTKRVDQLNEVSNVMAVSTGDLTAGLQRASAGMAISGNSFEQTTALLTAGVEVIRDAEIIARSLTTISQRIFDKGADALKQYGIETTNANGSIRSTFDILTDLHNILPTITEDEQRWLLSAVSGKEHFKSLTSIMQNWNAVSKTMEVQMNANGSATEELNRKLDSLEGRMNKATNAVSKFWNATINSGLVKTSISLFTEFTDVLSTLTTATGGLILPTTLLVLALMKFKDVTIVQTLLQATSAMVGLTVVEGTATIATIGLTTSVATLQLALGGIALVLGAVAFIYNKHIEAVSKAEEETIKFKSAQEELNKTLAQGDSSTKSTVNELEKLSETYDNLILKQKELQKQEDERDKKSGSKGHERYKRESEGLKEVNKELEGVESKFKKLGTTAEEASKKIKLGNDAMRETKQQSEILTQTMDNLSKTITDSSDNYGLLNDSQNELNKNGFITQSTIDAINEKYGKFIDVTKLSKDAMTEFFNVEKNGIRDRIKNNIIDTQSELEKRKKTIEGIKAEILALGALAKVKGQSGTVAMYEQYAKGRQLEGVLKEVEGFENKVAVMQNSLKIFDTIDKDKGDTKKKSTSTPSIIQDIDLQKERYASLTMALNSVNNELERNKALQEKDIDLASLNKLREDEIDIIKKKQIAIQNLTKEQQKERDELVKSLNAQGVSFSGKGDSAQALNAEKFLNTLIEKMNALKGKSDKASTQMFANLQSRYKTIKAEFDRFAQLQLTDIPKLILEYEGLDTEINKVATSISTDLTEASEKASKAQQKATEDYVEEAQKMYKELWDYISDKEEERMREYKKTAKKNLAQLDSDLDALEQRYDEANKKLEKDDINKKITELISERNMRSIEGSIDANSRIYEIDKELVDLNKQLAEKERRDIYDKEKKVLENKKEVINSELDLEEEKSQEKLRMYQTFANQKLFVEKTAMDSTVAMLSTFDEQFKKDGDTKGQAWLSAFLAKVAMASMYFSGYSGGSSSGSSSTGSTQASGGGSGTGGGNPTAGVTQYATGGVNTYTGLAKLDGTKSLPEVVLNPSQISNISSKLGISGSPSQMAQNLYNTARSGVSNAMQGASVAINQTINAVINNGMDAMTLSKTVATETSRELVRNGIRL